MSMSMHCKAVKPADEAYERKAAAYRACQAAGIAIPAELEKFFEYQAPDPTGMTLDLGDFYSTNHPSCAVYKSDSGQGVEVDITKLPEGTRFVRFYCSW